MSSPLPTPEEMALWDRLTMEDFGLSGAILMENASRAALQILVQELGSLKQTSALVFAGSGNNGGDAFALARHLLHEGAQVHILHSKPIDKYQGYTDYHLQLALALGINCTYLPEVDFSLFAHCDLIIDGLLGTGFQGPLQPAMQAWVAAINELGTKAFVLALDIPSGLDGRTGQPQPMAVQAHTTISFEAAKVGLFLPGAQAFVGQLKVGKIGIPEQIKAQHPARYFALTSAVLEELKSPLMAGHKGSFGHVLVLGGSQGLTGAPLLAARAALRAGAGLVTLAGPQALSAHYVGFPEIMTLGLGSTALWSLDSALELVEHVPRFQALVCGPGLGRDAGARDFLQGFMDLSRPPTIFDADALYHLAQDAQLRSRLRPQDILTPHPGEMGQFFKVPASAIIENPLDFVQQLQKQTQAICILKGAGTIVAGADYPWFIAPFAAPNLAVAGTGDVLAGMLGSLVAQGYPALTAARIAVYWHSLAGKLLARDFPRRGNTPLELADFLPQVLKEYHDAHC